MTDSEINEYLATKLMGWTKTFLPFDPDNWWWEKDGEVKAWYGDWSPITNISQSFGDGAEGTVVGEMVRKGYYIKQETNSINYNSIDFGASFLNEDQYFYDEVRTSWAKTPASAICLAAVQALKGNNND